MPVVQYGAMLNGYTSINMTKLDVLDDLEELKIGVAYKIDGKTLPPGSIPSTLAELEKVEVEYETLPGWKQSIAHCRDFSELPAEAQVSKGREGKGKRREREGKEKCIVEKSGSVQTGCRGGGGLDLRKIFA